MFLPCHIQPGIFALASSPALFSPIFPLFSSILLRLYSPPRVRHCKSFATLGHITIRPGNLFNARHAALYFPPSHTMDSMPVRTVSVQNVDVLKIAEPETKTQHVENINSPTAVEHHEYLPNGLSQTDEEKKSHWYIGSIDCGTTSSRFLIFDGEGTPVASHQIEFENIYPESG